jgi:hypothetical protein
METRTWPKCAQLAVAFNGVTPKNFHFLLEKIGFHLINRWDEADIFYPRVIYPWWRELCLTIPAWPCRYAWRERARAHRRIAGVFRVMRMCSGH